MPKPKQIKEGVEDIDYVECKICGVRYSHITTHINMQHNINKAKYVELYNHPVVSQKFLDNCRKNSWMHTEDSKEFREKGRVRFKGEGNPSSKSNTTLLQRQQRSPYSIEFYKKKYPDLSEKECQKMLDDKLIEVKETRNKNNSVTSRLSYYTSRGHSLKEAKKLLKERQSTFTLEKCINKYGEEEGRKKYEERQTKWSEKMETKYKNGEYSKLNKLSRSSGIANSFIKELADLCKLEHEEYMADETNGELTLFNDILGRWYSFDFYHIPTKIIIEFHGDAFHGNSQFYKVGDKLPYGDSVESKWEYDKLKEEFARSKGYEYIVVWEYDFKNDYDNVMQRCKEHLLR